MTQAATQPGPSPFARPVRQAFAQVREFSEALAAPLSAEEYRADIAGSISEQDGDPAMSEEDCWNTLRARYRWHLARLAAYDLAQLLANKPGYVGVKRGAFAIMSARPPGTKSSDRGTFTTRAAGASGPSGVWCRRARRAG